MKLLESEDLFSISTHESRQQYSGLVFFVNVAVPLHSVSCGQTFPESSSQVSFWTWKFSGEVPSVKTKILSGISRICWVSFWIYDIFNVPLK